MGTNFYRIPTHEEIESRKSQLIKQINELSVEPSDINSNFSEYKSGSFDAYNPWDLFTEDLKIHLGKRSSGWRFCWNFHNNKYYTNKEQLLEFVRSSRVIDEYGTELSPEDFI